MSFDPTKPCKTKEGFYVTEIVKYPDETLEVIVPMSGSNKRVTGHSLEGKYLPYPTMPHEYDIANIDFDPAYPVQTRDGRAVKITHVPNDDDIRHQPIYAEGDGFNGWHSRSGHYYMNDEKNSRDLVNVPPKFTDWPIQATAPVGQDGCAVASPTFDPTKPCKLGDGREVEIIFTHRKGEHPLVALVGKADDVYTFTSDGRSGRLKLINIDPHSEYADELYENTGIDGLKAEVKKLMDHIYGVK